VAGVWGANSRIERALALDFLNSLVSGGARRALIWLVSCSIGRNRSPAAVLDTSQTRSLALEYRNMSGASSDSANEPNDQIEPVLARDDSAAASPLDFSGSLLGFLETSAGPAGLLDEPIRAPELALERFPIERNRSIDQNSLQRKKARTPPDPTGSDGALETVDLSDSLCAKIAPVSFGDRVFLFQSEAEAWRYAVETMRRYHRIVGRPKRRRLIVCAGVSDGAGGLPHGLEGDSEVVLLQTDDPGALAAEVDNRTAGILIAPVRTKAGFEVVPRELLLRLRETADEYGLILVFDESFCGLGRSGMLWAHEWAGVPPDAMVALHLHGNVPPLAALVVTQRLARGAPGPPLLVDPAALSTGHALVDALATPGFLERVQNRCWRLEDRLAELFYKRRGAFTALGGIGLMQSLTCPGEAEPMRAMLAERGLLTRAMGSFLGLCPPLAVEEREIDAAVSIIDAVCAKQLQ
jgi:acetylornithine/N-succinyldiaminopimelate aminotransferase